jgi:predicted metalloprotease with PDZ domain
MYVREYRNLPVVLAVHPYGSWHVTTGLEPKGDSSNVFGAPSYDVLADTPLEIGTQRDVEFEVEGKPHVLSIYGPLGCDIDTLIADVSKIVAVNARFWGGLPYRRYVFIVHAIPGGSGGTEHANSCVLTVPADPTPGRKVCRNLLGLFSHEFFHTWNVKQFCPKALSPYDWTDENYSREIWLAEGGTSYMHGRLMMRAGFSSPRSYASGLAAMIADERGRPGNRVQSVSDCSFDLWIRGKRRGDSRNFESDVYAKGAQVSLCLDLEIRQRSGNAHSFDDLLRTLLKRFPPSGAGYTVGDVERIAGELAGSSMEAFFSAYVHGVEPLPWERVLGYAGLALDTVKGPPVPFLGLSAIEGPGGTMVREVVAASPAHRAGVSAGDQIVALNGYRVTAAQLGERVGASSLGDTVRVTVFREERLRVIPVALDTPHPPAYEVRRVGGPTPLQKSIYTSWTGDPWEREGTP